MGAQETHAYVRSWFKENYSDAVAENVVIQYGGSVNAENVDELMACPDIDGALVGGASLKGESFSAICNFKQKYSGGLAFMYNARPSFVAMRMRAWQRL